MQSGSFNLPLTILQNAENHVSELNKYRLWICETVKYLFHNKTLKHLKADASRIINFEIKLAKLSVAAYKFERMSIGNLSEQTGLKWVSVFNNLLLGEFRFNETDEILVHSTRYLNKLIYLINKTDKSVVGML